MYAPIRQIYVEQAALTYETTRRVLHRLAGVPVRVISHREELPPPDHRPGRWWPAAKRTLLLAVQKGPFWRPCPGTRDYVCCGYQVLQTALNCPFDCRYCILQGYLNQPALTLFVNLEDLLAELEQRLSAGPRPQPWRLGTGEFGDSLALDPLTGLNERLFPLFARYPHAVLEIKSKWHGLEHLLHLGPNPQVIFAWSLNPPAVIQTLEPGTAPLEARLTAAARAAAAGFRLAFHFDPLIFFPGWESAYQETVAHLARTVPARAVTWISLGCLRLLPPLRRLILERFPGTSFAAQEMLLAPDGKLRYFRHRRVEMYRSLRAWLESAFPGAATYLCMESPRVWREVYGLTLDRKALARRLDGCVPPGTAA